MCGCAGRALLLGYSKVQRESAQFRADPYLATLPSSAQPNMAVRHCTACTPGPAHLSSFAVNGPLPSSRLTPCKDLQLAAVLVEAVDGAEGVLAGAQVEGGSHL